MKKQELIELIQNPSKAGYADLDKLVELKKQFPFFQSAHMLLSIVAKRHDTGLYQQTLRSTAITVTDRSRLHSLLFTNWKSDKKEIETEKLPVTQTNTDLPVQTIKNKDSGEIDHLKAIELVSEKSTDEKLTDEVEKHIEKDVVNAFVEKQILKTNEWYKKDELKEENKAVEQKKEEPEQLVSGSFTDWLKQLNQKKEQLGSVENENKLTSESTSEKDSGKIEKKEESAQQVNEKKQKQKAIIDKIIEVDPSRIRLDPNQRFFAADIKAKESLFENEELVTETLAKIYALQGNINKAIRAYEILSLKFPQKSAYFATLIQNLKKQNT